jgi:perosamine synthetase
MNKRIPLSVPFFQGNEKAYVDAAVASTWVSSGGAFIDEFEKKMAEYNGARFGIACASGTAALHVALIESGVESNDEVIVPTVTFIAPVNTIRYAGAYPVFMDCDDYLNIDCEKVGDFLGKECKQRGGSLINRSSKRRVKAILPVHVFGNPADLERLSSLAKQYGLAIVEDATESLGSFYKTGELAGKKTGTIGKFGCYSFNGNKIITTGGGGMIVTDDEQAARHLKYLTTQAKDDELYYIHNEIGYNYRMTNLQAAIGLAQLELLDSYIQKKRDHFARYKGYLADAAGLTLIGEPAYGASNYWFYSLIVDKYQYGLSRDELLKLLMGKGIEARPLWRLNHLQKPYQEFQSYKIEKAVHYQECLLNLPCSVGLTAEEQSFVVEHIKKKR